MEAEESDSECVICMNSKKEVELPCKHRLCQACAAKCEDRCPFCRYAYIPEEFCGEGGTILRVFVFQLFSQEINSLGDIKSNWSSHSIIT